MKSVINSIILLGILVGVSCAKHEPNRWEEADIKPYHDDSEPVAGGGMSELIEKELSPFFYSVLGAKCQEGREIKFFQTTSRIQVDEYQGKPVFMEMRIYLQVNHTYIANIQTYLAQEEMFYFSRVNEWSVSDINAGIVLEKLGGGQLVLGSEPTIDFNFHAELNEVISVNKRVKLVAGSEIQHCKK